MVWAPNLENHEPEEQPFLADHPVEALAVAFCLSRMFEFKYQEELEAFDTPVDHVLIYRLILTEATGMTLKVLSKSRKATSSKGYYFGKDDTSFHWHALHIL